MQVTRHDTFLVIGSSTSKFSVARTTISSAESVVIALAESVGDEVHTLFVLAENVGDEVHTLFLVTALAENVTDVTTLRFSVASRVRAGGKC